MATSFSGTVCTASDNLTLRTGPGTNYATSGSLSRDGGAYTLSTFTGYGDAWKTWLSYNRGGTTVYCSAKYIAGNPNGSGGVNAKVTTKSDSLNLRELPDASSTRITTLGKNSIVQVIDFESVSGWFRVASSAGTGWASSEFLALMG